MFHRAWLFMFVVFLFLTLVCLPATAQPMPHGWSKRFGDASPQFGKGVAVDGTGNSVVTGYFQGTADFGGGALTSAGGNDIFLAKFDAAGTHLWSKGFGNVSFQTGSSVAIDGTGNIVMTGYFQGTVDFGGGVLTSAGSDDVFLAKFDAAGTHLWSRRFGNASSQSGYSVAVDGMGNIVVAGYFEGTVDFGGGALTSAGSDDVFLAKFDAAGTHLWSRRFGDASSQGGYSVAIDGTRNIVVTGRFQGTVDFGGGAITSAGDYDVFLAKFDAAGTHLWSKRFGSAVGQVGYCVGVDSTGNIIVTGYFFFTVDFGGGALTSAGSYDIFIAKFDAAGTHLWSKGFGDASAQLMQGVAVDGTGSAIVTGYFGGTVDFGGGTLTSAGGYDGFLAKFDGSGTHLWSQRFGDASANQAGQSVAVDGTGNIIVTGYFYGTVDFGGVALTSAGSLDIFLAKFMRAAPKILTISDVPSDQGKRARISWLGSAYDGSGSLTPITEYAIYRKIDYSLGSQRVSALSERGERLLVYPPGDWDYVRSISARAEDSYFAIVPTLADSTITGGMHYSTFFVSALTGTPGAYYDALPDSGYSVDNLAPVEPGGFAVAYNTGSGNYLSWDESEDEDFRYFCIYRGTSPDFTPGAETLVDMATAAEWTDPEYDGWVVYYKITAVDFSGNESDPVSPETVTSAGTAQTPKACRLGQNYPNPFNPGTLIPFDIKDKVHTTLRIYNVSGEVVRTLVDEVLPARSYTVEWNGRNDAGREVTSGVYFYKLEAGDFRDVRKLILMK